MNFILVEWVFGGVCLIWKLFDLTDAICRSIACFYTTIFHIMSDNPPDECVAENVLVGMITKRSMQIGNITVRKGYGICIWFNLAIKYFWCLHLDYTEKCRAKFSHLPILKYIIQIGCVLFQNIYTYWLGSGKAAENTSNVHRAQSFNYHKVL